MTTIYKTSFVSFATLFLFHCSSTTSVYGNQRDLTILGDGGVDASSYLDVSLGEFTSTFDPNADNDHDGYKASVDCNDSNAQINPGAFEIVGDHVDNNCDGTVDEPTPSCDQNFDFDSTNLYASTNPLDYLKAMGLCQVAKEDAEGKERTWGVIEGSVQLTTIDGQGTPDVYQYGIQKQWGLNVEPREGASLLVLATGSARLPGQPDYRSPYDLTNFSPFFPPVNRSVPPEGWPQWNPLCPTPSEPAIVYSPVVLRAKIRVPTNANAFSFDFSFYTAEYPRWICGVYNDSFIALLKTQVPIPEKQYGNIVFDAEGNPINVNNAFFEACAPAETKLGYYECKLTDKPLQETGFQNRYMNMDQGGATSWLRTTASVKPGEVVEIAFMIWNTQDRDAQSTVLLDRWQWNLEKVETPVTTRPR